MSGREAPPFGEAAAVGAQRIASNGCPHRPPCPGCPRFGRAGISQVAEAKLARLAEAQGLPIPELVVGSQEHYRHRARLAVRGRARNPKLGIFQQGSHDLVDIPNCVVHHPLINAVAGKVKRILRDSQCPPYSDHAEQGLVRYLQLVVERASATVQLVVVTNSDTPAPAAELLRQLSTELGAELNGLFWNGNPAVTNTILGPYWQQIAGSDATRESLAGSLVFFPPGAFGQNNLPLYEHLVEHVQQLAGSARNVVELYAGTGAIGLGLLRAGSDVVFNEIAAPSLAGLELGLRAVPEEVRARARVCPGSAADFAATLLGNHPDLVIADPPRKGLDQAVLEALLVTKHTRFIYVSCDLDSFLRDADLLLASQRFRVAQLTAYAMFPYTEHVEILALFEPL